MKKYDKKHQRILANWAAECAKRVLPLFEKAYPKDERPRKAIEACRRWAHTGDFKMSVIRGASLAAHAAARKAVNKPPVFYSARSAGQAVAAAHVPQHAFGASYYALKAVAAASKLNTLAKVQREHAMQSSILPNPLKREFQKRVIIDEAGPKFRIRVIKDKDF